jgi:hypothetical protein
MYTAINELLRDPDLCRLGSSIALLSQEDHDPSGTKHDSHRQIQKHLNSAGTNSAIVDDNSTAVPKTLLANHAQPPLPTSLFVYALLSKTCLCFLPAVARLPSGIEKRTKYISKNRFRLPQKDRYSISVASNMIERFPALINRHIS